MSIWEVIKRNKDLIAITVFINFVFTLLIIALVGGVVLPAGNQRGTIISPIIGGTNDEEVIPQIVEAVNPAVVSIIVTKDVPIVQQQFGGSDFFREFFGLDPFNQQSPSSGDQKTEKREIGGGSGFIVSGDGLVVTNRHVVADEEADYTVFTNDGKKYDGQVIARDTVLDVAILRIKGGAAFPFLKFGDSDALKIGQTVIAIGNALGEFRNSVSVGVVSGLARTITAGDEFGRAEQLDEVIQTDAAINPGNSGGPLLNTKGQVVGVNVAVVRGSENIGFALPANVIKGAVESVEKTGAIVRPWIGVRYVLVTEELKQLNDLSVDYGALISRGENKNELAVIPGSPADKAGLVENDIILEIDGVKIEKGHTLASVVRKKSVGDTITLTVLSKGKTKEVKVTLEKAPN